MVLTQSGNTITGTAGASGPTVLVITIDPTSGDVTLDQQRAVRQGTPGNTPDAHDESISLNASAITLTATATDGDGDVVSSTRNVGGSFVFEDDGPSITLSALPTAALIVDETALRRPVGGPEVMRAQIDRLLDATKLPNVTLQVAPFSSGPHPGTYGPFVLFRFAMPELPDMVYSEYLTGAVYLDARAEVATHLEVMDRMAAQAATAHRTKEILRDLRKEL